MLTLEDILSPSQVVHRCKSVSLGDAIAGAAFGTNVERFAKLAALVCVDEPDPHDGVTAMKATSMEVLKK